MVDDLLGDDLVVREDHHLVVHCPDPRAPERDLLDGPEGVHEVDVVAHDEGPVEQDGDAGDEVLDRVLGREPERDSGDPEPGHERRHVDPELGEHGDGGEREDRQPDGPHDQLLDARVHAA